MLFVLLFSISTFIQEFRNVAEPICNKYGVNVELCIAQAVVESGWSMATYKKRNYRIFNVVYTGQGTFYKTKSGRRYRTYPSFEEAIESYCKVVTNEKYYPGLTKDQDFHHQLNQIIKGGYAESKSYRKMIISVYNMFK